MRDCKFYSHGRKIAELVSCGSSIEQDLIILEYEFRHEMRAYGVPVLRWNDARFAHGVSSPHREESKSSMRDLERTRSLRYRTMQRDLIVNFPPF